MASADLWKPVAAARSLRLEQVPDEAADNAARVIFGTVGVVIGGGKRPEIEYLVREGGPLFPPLAGWSARILTPDTSGADPTVATFVNATAGTFLELDEGCRREVKDVSAALEGVA